MGKLIEPSISLDLDPSDFLSRLAAVKRFLMTLLVRREDRQAYEVARAALYKCCQAVVAGAFLHQVGIHEILTLCVFFGLEKGKNDSVGIFVFEVYEFSYKYSQRYLQ
uniref:Uncharacterized protein n=1 Tax=Salix viminalis TaxID=40686 RepID=A0A6N2KHP9_SALVM